MRYIISMLVRALSTVLVLSGACNAFTTRSSVVLSTSRYAHHHVHPPTSRVVATIQAINHHGNDTNIITRSSNLHMARNNDIEGTDRVLACLPYIIPLLE